MYVLVLLGSLWMHVPLKWCCTLVVWPCAPMGFQFTYFIFREVLLISFDFPFLQHFRMEWGWGCVMTNSPCFFAHYTPYFSEKGLLSCNCLLLSAIISIKGLVSPACADIPLFDSGIGNVQCSGSEPTYTCAVMTGSGGVLNCSAIGSPTPTVTPDPSTASTVVFMNDQFSITGADTGTAGTYSCNASNSVGSAVRTFQVWVGGK